jgi:hypothetical protein
MFGTARMEGDTKSVYAISAQPQFGYGIKHTRMRLDFGDTAPVAWWQFINHLERCAVTAMFDPLD